MNKERLLILAEVLESDRAQGHFDMATYFFADEPEGIDAEEIDVAPYALGQFPKDFMEVNCNTTACMAGWAVVEFDPKYQGDQYHRRAQDLLDLSDYNANELFTPSGSSIWERDPKKAAKVIRHLVSTGEVAWSVAYQDDVDAEE